MSFSERSGVVDPHPLQRGSMDGRLKNGLWNAVDALFKRVDARPRGLAGLASKSPLPPSVRMHEYLWVEFLGCARDQFASVRDPLQWLRQWFFEQPWHCAYDLIETVAALADDPQFTSDCDHALARERAAYRLVQGQVVELTDEGQIKAVDDAASMAAGIPGVHDHLRTALARLADRPEPDCRNAMKEAISAVEGLAKRMVGVSRGTLADALKSFEKRNIRLHPALNRAWQAIYGYTNDEGGVRHALTDESNVDLAEAIYMVVSCSAFVSYLISVAGKGGIDLRG